MSDVGSHVHLETSCIVVIGHSLMRDIFSGGPSAHAADFVCFTHRMGYLGAQKQALETRGSAGVGSHVKVLRADALSPVCLLPGARSALRLSRRRKR